jgi:SAM-dependent methyltransferase
MERGDVLEGDEDVTVELDVRHLVDVAVRGQHTFLVLAAEKGDLDLLPLVLARVVLHGSERSPPLIVRSPGAGTVGGVSSDPYGWDERVEAWEEVATSPAFLAIRDRILQLAEPRSDDQVVDLGAGTGLLALALAPYVRELVAVDISERMLERLDDTAVADGVHNVEPLVADLRRLPLEDESATLVVSNYAFHHLDDAGKELALSEARRILRPGGRLVLCDMMFSLSLERRDRRLIWEKVTRLVKRGPHGVVRILRNAARLVAGRWE